MLQGHTHTGMYTILYLHAFIPMISLRVFGVAFGLYWAEINKEQ